MAVGFAISIASNLVLKLGDYLFTPIGRQFGYVLCYKSHVEDLRNGVEKLENVRERVQHSVLEAEYNGKPMKEDIMKWLKSVENEAAQARNLLKDGEGAKNACFHGWLPNPVVRHPIGRKVKKMTQAIQVLHDESKNSIFQEVYYENIPIGIVTATTSAARSVDKKEVVLESRASIIEDVLKAIFDDKVYVIGVYGPGGVGKSKLLEDIERRVKEEKLFDVVVRGNVSRNPDLKRIQGEIADALSLNLIYEETTYGRAKRLHERLESDPQKNILIMLDGLWKKLELKEVGIPCGDDNKVRGYKLLLTSRYRDVLRCDMCSDREFQLNELKHKEARRLFERIAGERVNDPELRCLVDGVVKNCGGLPLLIVSVAKRIKNDDLAAWRNALTNTGESDVKSLVKLNYNDLKDERIKSLFLLCALGSGRISVRDFLVYCMGLGLYKKFSNTIENARDRLIMDLRILQDSSLLLGNDDMDKFRMHDIFVDAAISITSTEWNALVGRKDDGFEQWSKDELRECSAMSFRYVGIDELPEKLDCPNLRMLLLIEKNPSLKIPESFFESMEKLQVLDLTHLSLTSLPSSIMSLENLKSLCLDQCHLEDVTIVGKLKGLQFLSLFKSTIARLPKEIGELTKMRFLDLRGCTRLKIIEPGVLGRLVNIEELYMEDSFDQWEAEDEAPRTNASLTELKNMKKLSTLYIVIPHSTNLSRELPFGKLNKYRIQIGNIRDWSGEYRESRTLKLKLDSGNFLLEEWVPRCLQRTQHLHLDGLQDGKDSINDLCVEGFQHLKYLHVQNSPSFQYVVHSIDNVPFVAFTRLEWLFLENLNNLKKICHSYLAPESFSKLKIVKVDNCGKIEHLFPLSMMRQLEEIEISKCHLMQQIVADVEPNDDRDEIDVDPKVKSCNLRRLTLRNLPEMISFTKTMDHSVIFFNRQQLIKLQNLEAITIERCQLIQKVFDLEGWTTTGKDEILSRLRELTLSNLPSLGHIWNKNPQRTLYFQNLGALKVQNCENLRFLFSASVAKALVSIKEIQITSCVLMEEIIEVQEEEFEEAATTDKLEFPLLNSLFLEELSNLRTFSSGKYCIYCPSLTRLRISRCPKMTTFSSLEGEQQSMIADVGLQLDPINSGLSLPVFFNEKVKFPNAEFMKISYIDNVEKMWLDDLASDVFRKLKTLKVANCEKLSSIFSSYVMLTRFQNLEKITVTECASLEVIFLVQEFNFSEAHSTSTFELRELAVVRLPKMKHVWSGLPQGGLIFRRLRRMEVIKCDTLKSLFPSSVAKSMTQLEEIFIRDCGVEEIIMEEDRSGMKAGDVFFPRLTSLRLLELPELRSFYKNSHTSTWLLLKELRVQHCSKIRSFSFSCEFQNCQGTSIREYQPALFSFEKVIPQLEELTLTREDVVMLQQHYAFGNMRILTLACYHDENVAFPSNFLLQRFPNLEELSVICSSFEEIFPEETFRHEGETSYEELTGMEKPLKALGLLKRLDLMKLGNLRRVWKNGSLMIEILRQLEVLMVRQCPSLSIVFPSPTSFQSLTELEIEDCNGLVHMGTCSAVTSLVHLNGLTLRNCSAMEDAVTDDENVVDEISFSKLQRLILDGLPSLESFSITDCAFMFPSLVRIIVKQCPKMNIFCKGTLRTPELDKVLLSEEDDGECWEGDLNTTIQTLSTRNDPHRIQSQRPMR